jgi:hypothetical protein
MPQKRTLTLATIFLLIALLAVACGSDEPEETPTPEMAAMAMPDTPGDLDMATTKLTEDEAFQVTISSNLDPLSLNEIHSWTVHVETADGEAVENAEIAVDGGMPEHNHGFPTAPEITEESGGGEYLLEGVKFSMAGWWELKLDITAGGQTDSVTFNIMLP